jgi:TRAP-type uncharacterized transport system fused permease subunit
MVEELSPGLSAFWGSATLILLVVTQRPLTAFFRGERGLGVHWRAGAADLVEGLAAAGRNMTAVGIATATAGIIVGTVLLTGIGLVMTEIVEFSSHLPHTRHGHADDSELCGRGDVDGAGPG